MRERVDEIGFGGLKLLQDADSFCYGVDAVLLADISGALRRDRIMDLCCGNGAVSLILCGMYSPSYVMGLDIDQSAVDLAKRSAALNGLEDKLEFFCVDAKDAARSIVPESFDKVVCNPPYFEGGRGVSCASGAKNAARHETSAGLEDFFRVSSFALKQGGSLSMVHRPERLADLMALSRKHGLEAKLARFVVPRKGQAANIVLIQFVKGGGKGLKMLPELAVRNEDGGFTEEINAIYRRNRQ